MPNTNRSTSSHIYRLLSLAVVALGVYIYNYLNQEQPDPPPYYITLNPERNDVLPEQQNRPS